MTLNNDNLSNATKKSNSMQKNVFVQHIIYTHCMQASIGQFVALKDAKHNRRNACFILINV